jgi:capping protein alpha
MASEDEYTPAQKQKIARHFVLVAPHGEVHELTKDLRAVVPASVLDDAWLASSVTEYNKRRFVVAEGDTSKVICCPQGEVEPNQYLNPETKKVCTIDPLTAKVTSERAGDGLATGSVEDFRTAISAKLKSYLSAYYEDGTTNPTSVSRGTGAVYASPTGQIAIVISFKNLSFGNFWTGGWQSEWTFDVSAKTSTKLEGRIRLNAHFFEDGNVQLNGNYTENGEVDISDPETTAEAVINTITTLENDFQLRLDKFYVQMHDSTFKNMRRFLPKIGKKMDWRSSVHALIAESGSG